MGSDPVIELQADEYAGETLAKMGACLSDAQAAFNSRIMQNQRGETHPPIAQRLAAVERGWRKFGKCGASVELSQPDLSQAYLKMDIDGRLSTIQILPVSDSDSSTIVSSTSTSNANSNSNSGSSTQTISDSASGNSRRVIVNGDHVVKTFYLEDGRTAEVNLWGQNIKLYISQQISDRVKVNDRGKSNNVIFIK